MKYEQDTSGADDALSDTEKTLRVLCHELSGLIDGAFRYVELARKQCADSHGGGGAAAYLATAGTALNEATKLLKAVNLGSHEDRSPISRLATIRPVGESVEHAVDLARTAAMTRAINIVSTIDPEFRALGPAPIFPVVNNALRNALEMTPRDGTIELSAFVETGEDGGRVATLLIVDDGPGPTRDAEQHAFELGYTTRRGGLGVGLALARSIIEDLGGRIVLSGRVSSDGQRGGSLRASWPVVHEETLGRSASDSEGRAA